jgi:hypothetical protein
MIPNNSPDPHDAAIRVVRTFFTLIGHGRWGDALALIDAPNSYGVAWSEQSIRTLIEHDIFGPDTIYAREHPEGVTYTSPDLVSGHPSVSILNLKDGSGFTLEQFVPLNGQWSELTVQFEFMRRHNGYEVILHDLHVL